MITQRDFAKYRENLSSSDDTDVRVHAHFTARGVQWVDVAKFHVDPCTAVILKGSPTFKVGKRLMKKRLMIPHRFPKSRCDSGTAKFPKLRVKELDVVDLLFKPRGSQKYVKPKGTNDKVLQRQILKEKRRRAHVDKAKIVSRTVSGDRVIKVNSRNESPEQDYDECWTEICQDPHTHLIKTWNTNQIAKPKVKSEIEDLMDQYQWDWIDDYDDDAFLDRLNASRPDSPPFTVDSDDDDAFVDRYDRDIAREPIAHIPVDLMINTPPRRG